ncbi:glycosyltransferase family 4 protein [Ahniella affigens]|uniref:glycosyltransferase family 4 protein n=1 Tax=Ahniella affigens TaxID=2021234 RepID=UPI001475271D|nr:glycosyltransferase family 4 protein [Ahniella affigens]
MIRILALVTDAWGAYGGIAQYNRDLLEALSDSAAVAHIDVLSLGRVESPQRAKIAVRDAGGSRFRFVAMALRAVRRQRPTVIFCAHIHFMRVAAIMKRISGRPIWLQIHGIDAWERPRPADTRATLRADLVTAVSRFTRARFLSWAALAPEHVHVLPNTVQAMFHPGPRRSAFRQAQLVPTAAWPVLCTVARLSSHDRYKGIDRVIAALPDLICQYPDLIYLIAGGGDDQARLAFNAERLGVSERVRFLGRVEPEVLPQLYRESDLFVMPSTKEGFGIVFIEAMACGTPALGLDVDGSVDALLEGQLGHLADMNQLPASIAAAVSDTRDRESLSQKTLKCFGKPAFAANIARLLKQIEQRFAEPTPS